jgi:hypothetical protein
MTTINNFTLKTKNRELCKAWKDNLIITIHKRQTICNCRQLPQVWYVIYTLTRTAIIPYHNVPCHTAMLFSVLRFFLKKCLVTVKLNFVKAQQRCKELDQFQDAKDSGRNRDVITMVPPVFFASTYRRICLLSNRPILQSTFPKSPEGQADALAVAVDDVDLTIFALVAPSPTAVQLWLATAHALVFPAEPCKKATTTCKWFVARQLTALPHC